MTLSRFADHQLHARQEAAQDTANKLIQRAEAESRGLSRQEDEQVRIALRDLAAIKAERERRDAERATTYAPPETQRSAPASSATTPATPPDTRNGNFLPSLEEYRAMGTTIGSAGGFLVPSESAVRFFDRLRPESVVLSAGPIVLEMASDTLRLPKIGSSVTVALTAENAEIASSDLTLEALTLQSHKLAALCKASNELLRDANPAARDVLSFDLVKSIGAKLDWYCLEGASVVTGIRHTAGATVTSLGTDGAVPTLADILAAISRLESANAKPSAMFMHPRSWNTIKALVDGEGRYYLSPDVASVAPKSLFGIPVFTSSQISITETSGINADCSWIAIADMSQFVLGRRQDVEVFYDSSRYMEYDQSAARVTTRFDFGCLNAAAVEIISGVRSA
jgi:HK97 family phage major capsid protein